MNWLSFYKIYLIINDFLKAVATHNFIERQTKGSRGNRS